MDGRDDDLGAVIGRHRVRAVVAGVRVGCLESVDRGLGIRALARIDGGHGAAHPRSLGSSILEALAGHDAVAAHEGRAVGEDPFHLVADDTGVVAIGATEIDSLGAGSLSGAKEASEVVYLGGVRKILALYHGTAITRDAAGEGVGYSLAVRLGVGRHADLRDAKCSQGKVRHGGPLKVVGGGDPEVVVGPSRTQVFGERQACRFAVHVGLAAEGRRNIDVLGQALVGIRGADLDQVGAVGFRDLSPGHAGVERSDHGQDLGIVDKLLDILGALDGVVDTVDGVIQVEVLEFKTVNGTLLLNGELDTVQGRDAI